MPPTRISRPSSRAAARLILLHGLADEVISPNSTIDYYQQLIATVGPGRGRRGACASTPCPAWATAPASSFPTGIRSRRSKAGSRGGLAPATGVAVDAVAGTYGRTRPLCQYPAWPKYRGSGSLDAAVNYSCVTEVGDPLACPNLPAAVTQLQGRQQLRARNSACRSIRPRWPTPSPSRPACSAPPARSAAARCCAQGNCSYASGESGAVFSFAAGGVLHGGVAAPAGSSFAAAAGLPDHLRERGHADRVQPGGEHLQRGGRAAGHGRARRPGRRGAAAQCRAPSSTAATR